MTARLSLKYKELLDEEKKESRDKVHSFHRYFGKLIPAIPRFAIKNFTKKGDVVLDCFCGSGTTLVEAKLLDRHSYGFDLNPLSALIANVKANPLSKKELQAAKEQLFTLIKKDKGTDIRKDTPFCVNIDHWFKDSVRKDLVIIQRNINKLQDEKTRNFFRSVFSSFLRDASNADPRHVFPGYSKRMRQLDKQGLRNIQAIKMFERSVERRIDWSDKMYFRSNGHTARAYTGDARRIHEKIPKKVDLIVTNPPYISSIRYLETVKLEMYWLEAVLSREEYLNLDKQIIGTERFYKKELEKYQKMGLREVDVITQQLFKEGNKKMAKVVQKYFVDMRDVFKEMHEVLNKGGRIVMKISDSFVRGINVPTTDILVTIAKKQGFVLEARFKDEIKSRSLLTKRNYYSGTIEHDWILVFKKPKK